MAYQGRGAWNNDGLGGTLIFKRSLGRTVPGPYYVAPVPSNSKMIGFEVAQQLKAGQLPDLNKFVVFLAVKEIQKRLNANGASLIVDGMLGPKTDGVIKGFQRSKGLIDDGMIGPNTMELLIMPELKRICLEVSVSGDWAIVAGLFKQESLFDLGAVGSTDSGDIGMAQINGPSHPDLTIEERVDLGTAVRFAANRLNSAINTFNGNVRDAVASYNLGIGGCRTWIKAGRPDVWTPAGSTTPRNVKEYIDKILGAF